MLKAVIAMGQARASSSTSNARQPPWFLMWCSEGPLAGKGKASWEIILGAGDVLAYGLSGGRSRVQGLLGPLAHMRRELRGNVFKGAASAPHAALFPALPAPKHSVLNGVAWNSFCPPAGL